jgi:hypothetical protein
MIPTNTSCETLSSRTLKSYLDLQHIFPLCLLQVARRLNYTTKPANTSATTESSDAIGIMSPRHASSRHQPPHPGLLSVKVLMAVPLVGSEHVSVMVSVF